jgi:hypothetical protein
VVAGAPQSNQKQQQQQQQHDSREWKQNAAYIAECWAPAPALYVHLNGNEALTKTMRHPAHHQHELHTRHGHQAPTSLAHAAIAAPAAHTPGVPAVPRHRHSRARQHKVGAACEAAADALRVHH